MNAASRISQKLRSLWGRVPRPENTPGVLNGVWVDVGSHLGETTLEFARKNPGLRVYAFEPNVRLAAQTYGLLRNFTVIPMAVAEADGFAKLYINACDGASSLLPLNPEGARRWIGGELLSVESTAIVPTIRLDTFLQALGISGVDYLKVDAQGGDLSVIKSAGQRIRDVRQIKLEIAVTPFYLYEGAATRGEVIDYLTSFGFNLTDVESQTHGQEENLTFLSVAYEGRGT